MNASRCRSGSGSIARLRSIPSSTVPAGLAGTRRGSITAPCRRLHKVATWFRNSLPIVVQRMDSAMPTECSALLESTSAGELPSLEARSPFCA
jgi:hypothetical protein